MPRRAHSLRWPDLRCRRKSLRHDAHGGGNSKCGIGCGTVFELAPAAGGSWTEKVLHSFNTSGGGTYPYAGLILDAAGNLYGTTYEGGARGYGVVFEIKH